MSDSTEIKDLENASEEEIAPMHPQVNTKVMYYVVAIMAALAIASALLVVFGSSEDKTDVGTNVGGCGVVYNV